MTTYNNTPEEPEPYFYIEKYRVFVNKKIFYDINLFKTVLQIYPCKVPVSFNKKSIISTPVEKRSDSPIPPSDFDRYLIRMRQDNLKKSIIQSRRQSIASNRPEVTNEINYEVKKRGRPRKISTIVQPVTEPHSNGPPVVTLPTEHRSRTRSKQNVKNLMKDELRQEIIGHLEKDDTHTKKQITKRRMTVGPTERRPSIATQVSVWLSEPIDNTQSPTKNSVAVVPLNDRESSAELQDSDEAIPLSETPRNEINENSEIKTTDKSSFKALRKRRQSTATRIIFNDPEETLPSVDEVIYVKSLRSRAVDYIEKSAGGIMPNVVTETSVVEEVSRSSSRTRSKSVVLNNLSKSVECCDKYEPEIVIQTSAVEIENTVTEEEPTNFESSIENRLNINESVTVENIELVDPVVVEPIVVEKIVTEEVPTLVHRTRSKSIILPTPEKIQEPVKLTDTPDLPVELIQTREVKLILEKLPKSTENNENKILKVDNVTEKPKTPEKKLLMNVKTKLRSKHKVPPTKLQSTIEPILLNNENIENKKTEEPLKLITINTQNITEQNQIIENKSDLKKSVKKSKTKKKKSSETITSAEQTTSPVTLIPEIEIFQSTEKPTEECSIELNVSSEIGTNTRGRSREKKRPELHNFNRDIKLDKYEQRIYKNRSRSVIKYDSKGSRILRRSSQVAIVRSPKIDEMAKSKSLNSIAIWDNVLCEKISPISNTVVAKIASFMPDNETCAIANEQFMKIASRINSTLKATKENERVLKRRTSIIIESIPAKRRNSLHKKTEEMETENENYEKLESQNSFINLRSNNIPVSFNNYQKKNNTSKKKKSSKVKIETHFEELNSNKFHNIPIKQVNEVDAALRKTQINHKLNEKAVCTCSSYQHKSQLGSYLRNGGFFCEKAVQDFKSSQTVPSDWNKSKNPYVRLNKVKNHCAYFNVNGEFKDDIDMLTNTELTNTKRLQRRRHTISISLGNGKCILNDENKNDCEHEMCIKITQIHQNLYDSRSYSDGEASKIKNTMLDKHYNNFNKGFRRYKKDLSALEEIECKVEEKPEKIVIKALDLTTSQSNTHKQVSEQKINAASLKRKKRSLLNSIIDKKFKKTIDSSLKPSVCEVTQITEIAESATIEVSSLNKEEMKIIDKNKYPEETFNIEPSFSENAQCVQPENNLNQKDVTVQKQTENNDEIISSTELTISTECNEPAVAEIPNKIPNTEEVSTIFNIPKIQITNVETIDSATFTNESPSNHSEKYDNTVQIDPKLNSETQTDDDFFPDTYDSEEIVEDDDSEEQQYFSESTHFNDEQKEDSSSDSYCDPNNSSEYTEQNQLKIVFTKNLSEQYTENSSEITLIEQDHSYVPNEKYHENDYIYDQYSLNPVQYVSEEIVVNTDFDENS